MANASAKKAKPSPMTPALLFGVIWALTLSTPFSSSLHQGTHLIPIDFIASLDKKPNAKGHHEILFSNVLAQAQASMKGKSYEEALGELLSKGLDKDEAKDFTTTGCFLATAPLISFY